MSKRDICSLRKRHVIEENARKSRCVICNKKLDGSEWLKAFGHLIQTRKLPMNELKEFIQVMQSREIKNDY